MGLRDKPSGGPEQGCLLANQFRKNGCRTNNAIDHRCPESILSLMPTLPFPLSPCLFPNELPIPAECLKIFRKAMPYASICVCIMCMSACVKFSLSTAARSSLVAAHAALVLAAALNLRVPS